MKEEFYKRMKKHWAIGWVPSESKNWIPVKLRATKNATANSHED